MNEAIIAENIKKGRLELQLSVEQLAKRAGLTKGYVSKIENSDKAPPLSTLTKIASALNTDVGALLSGNSVRGENVPLCIVRADERREDSAKNDVSGYHLERLAYKKLGRNMEPFIITFSVDEDRVLSYEGEEFMYILEGTFEFVYDSKRYVLGQGDAAYYDANVPHSGRSVGEKEAKALVVLYYYRRRR
jgi:transcriptional regulator with XRE-family HTH domain